IVGAHTRQQRDQSAFGRVDIDISEVMEIGRVFQVAESGDAVNIAAHAGARRFQPRRSQRAEAEAEHVATRKREQARDAAQERLPVLAAFSSSHHQTFGKAATPYLGSGSGWLKRSHRAARSNPAANCGTT